MDMVKTRLALAIMAIVGMGAAFADAGVNPPYFEATLEPGESVLIEKQVTLPDSPRKLDVCLLVDLSGSYGDDLPNIKAQMPAIWDYVKAEINDVRWCLATFVDFPFNPWGDAGYGDYAYRLEQGLTPYKAAWVAAVNAMGTKWGYDEPESQYEALYQMATGAGNDVPPAGPSAGDIPAGQNPNWRLDATKILIITTDASFHNAGDSGPFPYPGPSAAGATDALVDAGIKVLALKAPGSTSQMDNLAAATGGSVQNTTSSSSDIGQAILDGFAELTYTVTGTPDSCAPLAISLTPNEYTGVLGGETVEFDELVEVPADASVAGVECYMHFTAGDELIGTQTLNITVEREVLIDVKSSINLKRATGVIPVVLFGAADFDVTEVLDASLRFGHTGTEQSIAHDATHLEDDNGDGYMDLVSHYVIDGTGILTGDTEAYLTGQTTGGVHFKGFSPFNSFRTALRNFGVGS